MAKAVNIWQGVPCASLSLDENDSDQKLPAARPAVLSMVAVSLSTQLPWDTDIDTDINNDNDEDDDDDEIDTDINGDDDNYNDDDGDDEDVCDFDLNNIEGMSEYEQMRMQRIHRNNARLASLGLLGGMIIWSLRWRILTGESRF